MHRTCFRCARCRQQLSPAGGYYETESGAFCCEVCPDEEPPSPVSEQSRKIRGDPEGMLAIGTDDEASDVEDEADSDAAAWSNMDGYSEDFESALEAPQAGSHKLAIGVKDPAHSSDETQAKPGDHVIDGANSSLAKSSSDSPFLSLKPHPKSSPIAKPRRKLLLEEESIAGSREESSEHTTEVKGAGSQPHQPGESQLAQRLHPENEVSKREDSCSDGVVLRKEETEKSSEEDKVLSARPFSVFDRVRMFEMEVKARQSLPKDSRSVVESDSLTKERDSGERLKKGKSVNERRDAESPSDAAHPPFPVVKGDVEVENSSEDVTSKPEDTETLEEEKGKATTEDIPFMDENSDIPHYGKEGIHLHEGKATSLPCEQVEIDDSSKKEVSITSSNETAVDLPMNEIPDPSSKDVMENHEENITENAINNEILPTKGRGECDNSQEKNTVIEKTEEKSEVDLRNECNEIVLNVPDGCNVSGENVLKESVTEKSSEIEVNEGNDAVTEHPKEVVENKVKSGSVVEADETKHFLGSPKDKDTVGPEGSEHGKFSVRVEYPGDLNPFGDEDEEEDGKKKPEVVVRKPISSSLNPFGSSDEDEDENEKSPMLTKLPVPTIRRSVPSLDAIGRVKEPSAEDRLNPFWSAGEDDDKEDSKERSRRKSLGYDSRPVVPVPKPRTVWDSITSTPEPSPLPRRGVSPSPSADSTLVRKRRKKPAPPPPMQQNAQIVPPSRINTLPNQPSLDISIQSSPSPSISTTTSPSGTPRRPRKSRPAPPRPVTPASIESPPSATQISPVIPSEDTPHMESPESDKPLTTKEEASPNGQDSKGPDETSSAARPPPESEKRQKDVENRNRRSRTSGGEEEDAGINETQPLVSDRPPDKSTFGQWKRKKGPAPPRPVPQKRKLNPHVPMSEIRRELGDIEVQQMELERQGVALERSIRSRFQQEESPNDAWIPAEVEAQVLQLFELVNEKNELFRRQAELMYMRRQVRLEEEHADLEFQIRCLMERPASLKTDADKEREEMLIQRLVEVVQARDEVVQCLESDRLREAQEDVTVRARLAGAFPGKAAEKGEEMEEEDLASLGKKGKKSKKEKKVWERMKKKVVGKKGSGGVLHLGKGKKKKDADKDVDEVEEEGRRKEGGAL